MRSKGKKCPRCGEKCGELAKKCLDCGLIFSRLENATNKNAKRARREKKKEYIIRITGNVSDIKYWKLCLMVIFLGLVGGHQFYVGNYIKGTIMLLIFLFTLFLANFAFLFFDVVVVASYTFFIPASLLIWWIWDMATISFKKFRIPVAMEMPE